MGPGTLVAARLGGVAFDPLGVACAALSLPVFLATGIAAVLMVAEKGERARGVSGAVASGIVLWASVLGANALFGTAPAGSVGAAVTLALHLVVHRLRAGRLPATPRLLTAVLPYAVLLGGVLVTSSIIRAVELTGTPWHLLSSPALWLLTAGLVALRSRLRDSGSTATAALRSWLFVGPATGLFILLGAVMAECGMSQTIATALASLGFGYLAATPLIGGLGGFVSGSNSGSNAMFAGPQAAAGVALGVSPLGVTAMQNVAGSLFIMSSPARVEFATRLCPDSPQRGSVMRGVLRVDLLVVTVLAGLSLLLLPRW
jgi:lactate permease